MSTFSNGNRIVVVLVGENHSELLSLKAVAVHFGRKDKGKVDAQRVFEYVYIHKKFKDTVVFSPVYDSLKKNNSVATVDISDADFTVNN